MTEPQAYRLADFPRADDGLGWAMGLDGVHTSSKALAPMAANSQGAWWLCPHQRLTRPVSSKVNPTPTTMRNSSLPFT